MNKKAVGTGVIILSIVLVVLMVVILFIVGIVVFGGDKEKTPLPEIVPGTNTTLVNETPIEPLIEETVIPQPSEIIPPLVLEEDVNLTDNPGLGRCEQTWPAGAGEVLGGVSLGEANKLQCTSQVTQAGCEAVDVYDAAGDSFLNNDGIPDCIWV